MRRRVGISLLLLVLGAVLIFWSQAGSFIEVFGIGSSNVKHFTGPLGGDRRSTIELKVGQVLRIEVWPVDGRTPALQIIEFNGAVGFDGTLVPVDKGLSNDRYRAVGPGRVDIGAVPRQVLDRCFERCQDLMGEARFVVSVVVTR